MQKTVDFLIIFCCSKLKKITAFCAAKDGTNIFVGTDSGNIHQVDVSTFRLSSTVICRESIMQQYAVFNSLTLCLSQLVLAYKMQLFNEVLAGCLSLAAPWQ